MTTNSHRQAIRPRNIVLFLLLLLPVLMACHCNSEQQGCLDSEEIHTSSPDGLDIELEQSYSCCPLDTEPGFNDVEACATGATCCADGTWQCNDERGLAACAADQVCTSEKGA